MPPKLLFLQNTFVRESQDNVIPRGPLTKGQDRMIHSRGIKLIDEYPEHTIVGDTTRLFTQEDLLSFVTCDTPMSVETDADFTNTVMDKRMGQTERNELCRTCGRGLMDCEGHPGAIPLPFTIANPRFWTHIVSALRLICRRCGNIGLEKNSLRAIQIKKSDDLRDVNRLKRLGELAAVSRKCKRCETVNYIYKNFSTTNYSLGKSSSRGVEYQRSKTDNFALLEFPEIEDIFSRVDVKRWNALGFNNLPIDFLIKRLYVQPVTVRMREYIDSELLESPITLFYDYIVKLIYSFNQSESSETERKRFQEQIYDFVHLFMTGSRRKFHGLSLPKRVLKVVSEVKSIPEALSGKTGFFRGSAMAKRTDFSARTVLGPAWNATFNEVGVPRFFSRCHTVQFPVTNYNLDYARDLWKSNRAASVILGAAAGRFYKIEIKKSDKNVGYLVQPGDTIRRFVEDGDPVNFNRQPTLDKYSYLAYSAVVENRKTIGLPSESTKTHNGDFDGDESNILTPQGIGTRVEARTICAAENNVIATASGAPKAALAYTSITSAYLLTASDTVIDSEDFEYASKRWMNPNGRETFAKRLYQSGIQPRSGAALFSIVFEPDFTYVKGTVVIENGILISGRLTKDTLGTSSRGIVDVLTKYYFAGSVSNFLKLSNRLLDWYISAVAGFTIKFRDIFPQNVEKENLANFVRGRANFIPNDNNLALVHRVYNSGETVDEDTPSYLRDIAAFVREYLDQLEANELSFGLDKEFKREIKTIVDEKIREIEVEIAALPDPDNLSIAEKINRNAKENNILNEVENIGNQLAEKIFREDNPMNVMSTSGSRGTRRNTMQIAGVLGEQFMNGDRPPLWCTRTNRYPDGSRTLPFFRPMGDNYIHEVRSTGFVVNSFGTGLKASEIPFHLASSRVGLIDTSLKSQITGAFQRLLIKYLEDFMTEYDGSTRIYGKQVQFMSMNAISPEKTISSWSYEKGRCMTAVDVNILVDQINAKF